MNQRWLLRLEQFAQPAAAAAVAVVTEISEVKGKNMNWLLAILNLITVIPQGIQLLHADKSLGDKTKMANDALNIAIAGAKATAPAEEQATVDAVSSVAQGALTGIVTSLHNAATPAPAA